MSRKLYFNVENLKAIKESMASDKHICHTPYCDNVNEAAPEVDEYEIGAESDEPPIGGNYYHINEGYYRNRLSNIDLCDVGEVKYEWYFDEDEYLEWLQDNELTDSEESRNQYYTEEVQYGVEYYDSETLHYMESDQNLSFDELVELFGEDMANKMLSNCIQNGEGSFEPYELYENETYDLTNPQEVNDIAMKLFPHGGYYRDCRGFILTNGVIVYTPSEHNEIQMIPGVKNKFDFIEMGNIRIMPNSIDIGAEPTYEQEEVLRELIASYSDDELYLDIFANGGEIGAKYMHPNWRYVLGEIDRFYSEGIKPQGSDFYEMKNKKNIIVNENTFEKWFGNSILKDEDGNPLKMYHGTDSEFDSFSKDFIGKTGSFEGYGFNFTPFYSRALGYNSKNVIEAYLKVENPMTSKSNKITLRQLMNIIAELDKGKPFTDTIVATYEPPRYNEKWDAAYYRRALPTAAKTIYDYNMESEYGDAGLYAEICLNGQADKIKTIDVFEKMGYDSAIFYDNDGRINTVVVFEPNQIKKTTNKTFTADSELMGENIDLEVSSSDIDLSSFKKKDELVPSLWGEDGKLDSRIRLKLLDIADDFWKFVNLTWVEPRGIILTGSICNFNWSQYSDIDLHLIVDFNEIDEKTEFVKAYLDSKKNEWNDEHSDLKIMGHQVELYTQNIDEMPQSSGIYDLEENDWIREPNPNDIKAIGLNKFSIKDKAAKIMTIIDDMCDSLELTDDSYEIRKIGDDANYLWKKIKNMRKISLDKNGENGNGNIVYKYMRRQGYLDKLFNLRTLCYDKENSINENKGIIKEYLEKDNNLPLYKYFKWASTASSCEKARDLAYSCPYYIDKYIKKIIHKYTEFEDLLDDNGNFDYEDDSSIETFLDLLKHNNLCDHFISEMNVIVDYYEQPTWMNTRFNRIVKNEWCIHFTKDAENIAKYGLTGGTNDISHLAYTNAGQEKPYEGYNFAFLIHNRSVDCNEYGDEAVIFRTSGVEVYHYGDDQNQVIFWGPNVKSFIPIHQENGDWVVYGLNGRILVRKEYPSEIAIWATENLPQYRKRIMTGKNGYIPKMGRWNQNKYEIVPYPLYKNESIRKYITLLKEQTINEETVADGSSNGNPYKERWKAEREDLKNYVCNFGTVMQSKEDNKGGKLYKVLYDKWISELIGYNYALCVQWDAIKLKPKSIVYVRGLDKFTPNIRTNIEYDARGFDNVQGTYDDDVKNYENI